MEELKLPQIEAQMIHPCSYGRIQSGGGGLFYSTRLQSKSPSNGYNHHHVFEAKENDHLLLCSKSILSATLHHCYLPSHITY